MTRIQRHQLTRTEAIRQYMRPEHNRDLNRRSTGLWKLLTSDAKFQTLTTRYEAAALADYEAARHAYHLTYWSAVANVTRTIGPDYRVHIPGQAHPIRANQWQHQQACEAGWPAWIEPDRQGKPLRQIVPVAA